MRCLINDDYNHLFTARKQNFLGQGNVSTLVCLYFCPQRGGVCLQEGGVAYRGGALPTGGGWADQPSWTRIAGGTHPNGMLSFLCRFAQEVPLCNVQKCTCISLVCLVPSPRRHLDSMKVSGLLCCKRGKKLTKVIIILVLKKIFLYNQKICYWRIDPRTKISYSAMFAPFHDNTAQTYVQIYVYKIMASDRRFGAWNKTPQNKVHQLISITPPK